MDDISEGLVLPPNVNAIDVQFLWNNIYKNNPDFNFASVQDMVNSLGAEGVNREIATWSNPEQIMDIVQPAENLQNANEQLQQVLQEAKPFNFKMAKNKISQELLPPIDTMGLNDSSEIIGDQIEEQQNILSVPQPPFEKIEDFRNWADNTDLTVVLQAIIGQEGDHLKEGMEQYFDLDDEGDKGILAARIFSDPSFPLRKEIGIMARPKSFGEVDEAIKKIAKKIVKKNKSKVFNLKKTAQHKTMNNVVLWGPSQSRIDPFLHQPVSDWNIVERNKGFGLVVDDIWNIDYETIWRENIMDKYSRPYKNKDGEWVGGYIQKRFEVDKWIPEKNNYQLKPGQLRKDYIPEERLTETRMVAQRASADSPYKSDDKSKPFNWKEASKKEATAPAVTEKPMPIQETSFNLKEAETKKKS